MIWNNKKLKVIVVIFIIMLFYQFMLQRFTYPERHELARRSQDSEIGERCKLASSSL